MNEPDSAEWMQEGWTIESALIPANQIDQALGQRWEHDFHFSLGWDTADKFDFAEQDASYGVDLLPWCLCWKHPIHDAYRAEPRHDFLHYHALDEKQSGVFHHPLDGIQVISVNLAKKAFFEPFPHVIVHRHYLRDYLAARQMVSGAAL